MLLGVKLLSINKYGQGHQHGDDGNESKIVAHVTSLLPVRSLPLRKKFAV